MVFVYGTVWPYFWNVPCMYNGWPVYHPCDDWSSISSPSMAYCANNLIAAAIRLTLWSSVSWRSTPLYTHFHRLISHCKTWWIIAREVWLYISALTKYLCCLIVICWSFMNKLQISAMVSLVKESYGLPLQGNSWTSSHLLVELHLHSHNQLSFITVSPYTLTSCQQISAAVFRDGNVQCIVHFTCRILV